MMCRWTAACLIAGIAWRTVAADARPPLFENGASVWTISVGSNVVERYAAREFQRAIRLMGSAELQIVTTAPQGPTVVLGTDSSLTTDRGEICLNRLDGNRLVLSGNTPRAVLYSMYAFLRRELGARWLWPQPDGEFLPRRDRFSVPTKLDWRYEPSYRFRCLHTCGDRRDDELKAEVSRLPITLFCLHGNKGNRPQNVGTYGVRNFCGGKVYYEPKYPHIYFAIDGEIYTFEGKK